MSALIKPSGDVCIMLGGRLLEPEVCAPNGLQVIRLEWSFGMKRKTWINRRLILGKAHRCLGLEDRVKARTGPTGFSLSVKRPKVPERGLESDEAE
jgi:hypothetical protein